MLPMAAPNELIFLKEFIGTLRVTWAKKSIFYFSQKSYFFQNQIFFHGQRRVLRLVYNMTYHCLTECDCL